MDETQILEKLKVLMNEQFSDNNYSVDQDVTPHSHFHADLGFDSLDDVELLMKVEKEYSIAIPDATAYEIKTVEDMIKCVRSYFPTSPELNGLPV